MSRKELIEQVRGAVNRPDDTPAQVEVVVNTIMFNVDAYLKQWQQGEDVPTYFDGRK